MPTAIQIRSTCENVNVSFSFPGLETSLTGAVSRVETAFTVIVILSTTSETSINTALQPRGQSS